MAKVWLLAAVLPLMAFQQAPPKQDPPKESRTAYVRRMYEKDRTSFGDACRAVASLAADAPTEADFATLKKDLAGRGLVDEGWGLEESSPVTKGTVAYMLCKALGIKGGLTAGLFGMTRRYALRECVFRRLIARGTTDEYVSGREFIDILTNAEFHKKEGSLDSQRK